MEECYSEVRGFERVSGTFRFVDMKVSNKHHATRVGLCSRLFVCVWGMKNGNCFLCSNSSFSLSFYFKSLNDGFSSATGIFPFVLLPLNEF